MGYTVPVNITTRAAARLILSDDVDLSEKWSIDQSREVLFSILNFPTEEILEMIDRDKHPFIEPATIPQFGNTESLMQVPQILLQDGNSSLDYPQLGFKLKKDLFAKMDANTKYGETYGKGAALLGIAMLKDGKFFASSLSKGFCAEEKATQNKLLTLLFFRIPIVKAILGVAKDQAVNGYSLMPDMATSTMKRRGQCLRAIFRELDALGDEELSRRIKNIIWTA